MEKAIGTKPNKATAIMGIMLIVLCVWFVVVFGLFVTSAVTTSVITADQVLYNFYAYGGIAIAGILCVAVFSLLAKKHRGVLTQVFLWITLLFSFNYSTLFIANVFNLRVMTLVQGLTYLGDYLPSLILCVVLVALLSQWSKEDKKTVNRITWVSLLVSAFFAAFVIYYIASVTTGEARSLYSGLFQITHAVVVPFAIGWLFCATRSRESFDRTFLAPDEFNDIRR